MYGLGMSGIPLEYQAELRRSQQQQMIAQSLMAQANEPLDTNQMAGGYVVPVNPLQGLGKVAQAYIAAKAMRGGGDAMSKVGEKYNADQSAAINQVQSALAPRTLPDSSAGAPATMERTPEERRAVVQQAMMSQFPNVRNFGTTANANMQADLTREDNQAFRNQTMVDSREQRNHERGLAIEERQRQEAIQEQVRKDQFAQQVELKKMVASGQGQSPYFQPVQTAEGVFAFNARTGKVEPVSTGGKQIVGAVADPALQGKIAGAKATGKDTAEATVKAQIGLPQAVAQADLASKQINDLLAHPGFTSTVGATLKPGARLIDGTPEADFNKRLDQLKGGAFLQAFEALKGGGQITEIEGKKATDAITRMDKAQSEKEFTAAAREFQGFLNKGVERAKIKAGAPAGGFDEGKEARYQAWKKSQGL